MDVLLEEWGRYATFSRAGKGGRGASGFLLCSRGQQAALPVLGLSFTHVHQHRWLNQLAQICWDVFSEKRAVMV